MPLGLRYLFAYLVDQCLANRIFASDADVYVGSHRWAFQ